MNFRNISILAIAMGLAIVLCQAQTQTQTSTPAPVSATGTAPVAKPPVAGVPKPTAPKAPSPVDSVIQMVRGGVSENIIIKSLQKSNKALTLSPSDLVKLKQANVSDNIIEVMMDPSAAPAPAAVPQPVPVEAAVPPAAVPEPAAVTIVDPAPAAANPGIEGDWHGTLIKATVVLHLALGGSGTVDSPTQKMFGIPLQYSVAGDQLNLSIPSLNATYTASLAGNQMTGTFVQKNQSVPLTLVSGPAPAPMVPAAPAVPARPTPQPTDWRSAIQYKIEGLYPPTKATADRSSIVAAGAVIVLKKDGLNMALTSFRTMMASDSYKDGKISNGFFGKLGGTSSRVFVRGEKFWLTHVEVKDDGLVLEFLSDPFDDSRYTASLKFPFAKGTHPAPDDMASLVGQVIEVETTPPAAEASAAAVPAPAPPPVAVAGPAPEPVMAAIAPPPPPADQAPATVKIGQTKEEVVANFGQPTRLATVGTKQILYYPDFKVTLVAGKVTDVQ